MKKTIILLLISMSFFLLNAERKVIRIANPSEKQVAQFLESKFEVTAFIVGEFIDLLVNESEINELEKQHFKFSVTQTEKSLKKNLNSSKDIDGYRNYGNLLSDLQQLETDHPDICKLYDIGDSWGKLYSDDGNNIYNEYYHEIWALKVSDNVEIEEDEPSFYYMAEHHAREPISLEVAMTFLHKILDEYGTNDNITQHIDNKQIWFIPLVNPNGHKVVIDQDNIWWRKNIRDNNLNQLMDCQQEGMDGVDPNRNYGFQWGSTGASDQFTEETYHGPGPFSEPETQAIRNLLEAHHFVAGISYHSYSELVLYPFGYANNLHAPDEEAIADLATSMANTIPRQNGGFYVPQASYDLYACMGTSDDYSYGHLGIFSYTIELGTEFIPPAAQIEEICENNMEAATILLNRVDNSFLTGHISNATTGNPLVAEVFIDGIDDSEIYRAPYKSNEEFGTYYRILMPGEYNVTYRAFGYISQTCSIEVADTGVTTFDVALTQAENSSFSGTVVNSFTDEPLSGARISFINAPIEDYYTDNDGSFSFIDVPIGSYEIDVFIEAYTPLTQTVDIIENGTELEIRLAPAMFYDGFENNLDNWTISGNWETTNTDTYCGSFSLTDSPDGNYNNNANTTITTVNAIPVESTNTNLIFMAKYNIETDYDYCYLQISNNETNWTDLDSFTGSQDWTNHTYSLSNYVGQSLFFRFKFHTDTYVTADGIYIDAFGIYNSNSVSNDEDFIVKPEIKLYQSYPNPFSILDKRNSNVEIKFNNPLAQQIEISIYNILGQRVKLLENKKFGLGLQHVVWDGKDNNNKFVSSGIYFYKLKTDHSSKSRKMILIN